MARADRLYTQAHEYYQNVMGPRNEYGIEALRRLSEAQLKDFTASDGTFDDRVLASFEAMYPQKFWHVGEARLRILIAEGVKSARSFSIANDAGRVLLIGLMFGFGHGAARDPWYH